MWRVGLLTGRVLCRVSGQKPSVFLEATLDGSVCRSLLLGL